MDTRLSTCDQCGSTGPVGPCSWCIEARELIIGDVDTRAVGLFQTRKPLENDRQHNKRVVRIHHPDRD